MNIKIFKNYTEDQRGATAIEFAILAPAFIAMLIGILEVGRILWTQQVAEEVAYVSARCSITGVSGCSNNSSITTFAVNAAQSRGITLSTSDITVQSNIMCNGYEANRVVLDFPTNSPVGPLIPVLGSIQADACFPVTPTP